MKTGCKQTAKFPPGIPIPPDADALVIARTWLADFDKGITAGDTAAISTLFVQDGFWRDILALTHDFRTAHTAGGIAALLERHLARAQFGKIVLAEDELRKPVLGESIPGLRLVQMWFGFETGIGRGSAVVRLVFVGGELGAWRACTMFTCLDELKGFPPKVCQLALYARCAQSS
jgi:hypothetical protein